MAQPGYSCVVRKTGISTTIAAEPCSIASQSWWPPLPSPNSTVFRITDVTRRCIDPNQPFNFKDGATTIAYSTLSIDFFHGVITTAAPTAGALTFNGNFLPITTASDFIPETKSYSLTVSSNLLDKTVMGGLTANFVVARIPALKDVSLTVESITDLVQLAYLNTVMFQGAPVVTEIYFGRDAIPRFRGLCLVESINESVAVDGLVQTSLSFKIAAQGSASAVALNAGFSFQSQP